MAKRAAALFDNLQALIRQHGVERIGFVTLTFPDCVRSREIAERRFHSFSTHCLKPWGLEFIAVRERTSKGYVHFHLPCAFPNDIASGFDFDAATKCKEAKERGDLVEFFRQQKRYIRSANDNLREWWRKFREFAPRYNFGRCETLPVLKNGEAVARYVGAYVGQAAAKRILDDKRRRSVTYSFRHRVSNARVSWVDGNGRLWRQGCRMFAALVGVEEHNMTDSVGSRWAWGWRKAVTYLGRNPGVAGEAFDYLGRETDLSCRLALLSEFLSKKIS